MNTESIGTRKKYIIYFFSSVLLVFFVVSALMLSLLKAYDLYLVHVKKVQIPQISEKMNDLVVYPYAMLAIRPYFVDDSTNYYPRNSHYNDTKMHTGKNGFFMDRNIDSPPDKAFSDINIVLIGGSAAQGWGASNNKAMIYSLLEKKLNAFYVRRKINFSVYNFAMGSSVTYQNFIMLNRQGHKIQPDIIVSFSGRNDFVVPLIHEDGKIIPYCSNQLSGLLEATRISNNPKWLASVYKFLPGIMSTTKIGFLLRAHSLDKYTDFASTQYWRNEPSDFDLRRDLTDIELHTLRDNIIQEYIDALKSIKRDFPSALMVVAFQPTTITLSRFPGIYDELRGKTISQLQHSTGWFFDDFQQYFVDKKLLGTAMLQDDCHLTNDGQELVSSKLAEDLRPVVDRVCRRRGLN